MPNYTVLSNQSLLDISVMLYGEPQFCFELALKNGLSLDADLLPGQVLQYDAIPNENERILQYLNRTNTVLASSTPFFDIVFTEVLSINGEILTIDGDAIPTGQTTV